MSSRPGQRGQAMLEYVVACALVTALMSTPVAGGRSTLQILLDGIQQGYARLVTAISVPI
jgi:hypothetical protein